MHGPRQSSCCSWLDTCGGVPSGSGIGDFDRQYYSQAVKALKGRLDPGLRTLTAQDFRHTRQKEAETMTDFIGRLEQSFQLAYRRDPMSQETREMLLYGQLQEGLRDEMLRSSAVRCSVIS